MGDLNHHSRISLSAKFNVLTISLILVTSVGISLYMIRTEMKDYYRDLIKNSETIADTTAKNCEYGIYTEDRASLLRVAESLAGAPDIAYLSVLKKGKQPIVSRVFKPAQLIPDFPFENTLPADRAAHADFTSAQDGQRYLEILFPVVSNVSGITDVLLRGGQVVEEPTVIGYLRLGMTQEGIEKRIHVLLISTTLFTSFLVLLGSGLTVLMTKRITSPLMKLTSATQDIANGKFDARIDVATTDEIAELAHSFDHMRVNLGTYRDQVEEKNRALLETNKQLVGEIAARKIAEEQLRHDALHDALTGLPNRSLFMDRLTHTIVIAKRRKDYIYAVLFLDIDRFKVINDSLGHIVGDQLLIAIGQRLLTCLRPGDTVARLGGDEFAVLLEDISGLGNATFIAERIGSALAAPFTAAGNEVFVTGSIGIALSAADYDYPEQVLRDADTAMYQAKSSSKVAYVVFEPGMHAHALERMRIETDLRRAVERKEFSVFYQPIVSLITGRLSGFEALVRWRHPERGLLNPVDFIQMAEETGIIVSIDRLMLRESCRQMREWIMQFRDCPLQFISVNLSNKQMVQPDLVEYVSLVLKETGLDPGSLKLEITENVIIDNPEETAVLLARLKALGVQLYIDDFGTGYSSLSYLHRLPIDGLKIDRSFIRGMGENGENQQIVKTIMLLARDMNIGVIAEGLETANQLVQIKALNCEFGQGYLFSKPIPGTQALALIEGGPTWKSMPAV